MSISFNLVKHYRRLYRRLIIEVLLRWFIQTIVPHGLEKSIYIYTVFILYLSYYPCVVKLINHTDILISFSPFLTKGASNSGADCMEGLLFDSISINSFGSLLNYLLECNYDN